MRGSRWAYPSDLMNHTKAPGREGALYFCPAGANVASFFIRTTPRLLLRYNQSSILIGHGPVRSAAPKCSVWAQLPRAQLRSCRREEGIGEVVRNVQAPCDGSGLALGFLMPSMLAGALKRQLFRGRLEVISWPRRPGVLGCAQSMRLNAPS